MTLWKRLGSSPILSVATLALWLVLSRSVSFGTVVVGLVLAAVVPMLTRNLRPTTVQVRRPWVALRFLCIVAFDVLGSNLEVARGLIALLLRSEAEQGKDTGPSRRHGPLRRPHAAFVVVPLDLRDPLGLAVLAMVATVVPGTVWSELALDRSTLLLHVWDVNDDDAAGAPPSGAAFVARFKERYEAPLREIFQ